MTSVSLGALVGARLSRAAITARWRARGGGDRPVGWSYPPRRPLPLRLAHHPPSRRGATFGALGVGARGEAFGSLSRSLATVLAATDNTLLDVGGAVKRIKHNLFTNVCKALGMRQLKFHRFLRVLGYPRLGYGIKSRLVEGLSF